MPLKPLLSLRLGFAPLLAPNPGDVTVVGDMISTPLYAVAPPGESLNNGQTPI